MPKLFAKNREKTQTKSEKTRQISFSSHDTNVADLLVAENLSERLINYLEQNYDIDMVEKYHRHIAGYFPEKTLALFKKALDIFMEKNTGRNSYEYAARRFDSMLKIEGGKEVVAEIIEQSKSKYKTRRAMQEIFSNYQKKL